jgi:hypothetical protein
MLPRPSEFSALLFASSRRRAETSSCRIGCPFRVHIPSKYHGIGFVIPLRRWAFPRPCGFPSAGLEWVAFQSPKSNPLVELGLRLESSATAPSRSTTVIRLLSWTSAPFSTFRIEGPPDAGFSCPLRSACRVWLPSWRLSPFDPWPVLFRTGSARGIRPSELSPPARYPSVSAWKHPRTVSPATALAAVAACRPRGPRFLGSCPCESP